MELDYNDNYTYSDYNTEYREMFIYSEIMTTTLSLIGIAADILIISTILSRKTLQTRSYLLLMNWAIFNVLYRIFAEGLQYLIPIKIDIKISAMCITFNIDMLFQFGEIVFLLALISNWAVKSDKMHTLLILFIFHALIITILVMITSFCMLNIFTNLMRYLLANTYLCLLVIVIVKNANRLWKARVDPLSEETVKRLNLASIYSFYMLVLLILLIPLLKYNQFHVLHLLDKSTIIIPYAFIIYLIKVDHIFKSSFLDLIKCRRPEQKPTENIAYDTHNDECVNIP
ncbi:PREDICTED: uncharacterized protein LOC108569940 isoform X8 [Nicrophorus vespilloides]|uniref:Uncharacterized protein LOC108569940 isoform X8 n=1 Tax=Nicrophorus vespilloides TaxID=110193 RepID=A0ABM1NK52_NICVS|nr:PREDICTED: uncharacterized protein LOC108569940 isoform X8 [Nicrophorus vespilloides]